MAINKRKIPSIEDLVSELKELPEKYIETGCVPFGLLSGGKGLRLGYLYQLFSSSGFGKCQLGTTPVSTSKGYLPMKDLVPVQSVKGFFSLKDSECFEVDTPYGREKVTEGYYSPSEEVFKFRLDDGADFNGTAEHPVLALRDGEVSLIPCGEIKKGDCLLRKLGHITEGVKTPFGVDQFYALGLWLGDGWNEFASFKRGGRVFGFVSAHEEQVKRYLQCLGVSVGIQHRKDGCFYTRFTGADVVGIEGFLGGAKFSNILTASFKFPVDSHSKFMPRFVFTASVEERVALLRGLIDTDGCISVSGKMSNLDFTLASSELLSGIVVLSHSLGIYPKIKSRKVFYRGSYRKYFRVAFGSFSKYVVETLNRYPGRKPVMFSDGRKGSLVPLSKSLLREVDDWIEANFLKGSIEKRHGRCLEDKKRFDRLYKIRRFWGLRGNRNCNRATLDLLFSDYGIDSVLRYFSPVKVLGISTVVGSVYDFVVPESHLYIGSGGFVSHNSTILLSVCRSLANRGYKSIYVASENNDELVRDMGLSGEKYAGMFHLLPLIPPTYKGLERATWAFFESDYTLMVIDSITACFPSKLVEEDISIEDNLPGINASIRGNYLRIIQGMIQRKEKTIIYLNQTRANFDAGWGGDPEKSEGGYANKFYCMVQATVRGDAKVPDLVSGADKKIVGKQGSLISLKNRCAVPGAKIPLRILFGKGVSNIYSLEHFAMWRGIITGAGAWFNCSLDGTVVDKVQGKKGRQEWVRAHQNEILDTLYSNAKAYYEFLLTDSESIKV